MSRKEYCDRCICTNVAIVYNDIPYCLNCVSLLNLPEFFKEKEAVKLYDNYELPTQILDNIYIGNLKSVDKNELLKLGIENIVICGRGCKNSNHDGFNNLHLILDDIMTQEIIPHVEITNQFLDLNENKKTLIHCQAGISRSGSILIGYLMHNFKYDYDTAFQFVQNKYPRIHPNSGFEDQLRMWKKPTDLKRKRSSSLRKI